MSGTLSLAAAVAVMNRDGLLKLARSRRVSNPAQVHDALSFAIELLRLDSITSALQDLHRESLETLIALSDSTSFDLRQPGSSKLDPARLAELTDAGLIGRDTKSGNPVALSEVFEQLSNQQLSQTSFDDVSDPRLESPTARAVNTAADTSADASVDTVAWFGAALTSARRAAKLLFSVGRHPIKLGRKGTPAVASLKDLAAATHCEIDEAARLIDVMRAASLLTTTANHNGAAQLVAPVFAMNDWLVFDYPRRWLALAAEAIAAFDEKLIRTIESTGSDLSEIETTLAYAYPLLPKAALETLVRSVDTCEDLGLTVNGQLTPAALALLADDVDTALRIAEADMPAPVAGIYLQPDLSIVVPGPLPYDDEVFLHTIAETEQLGAAMSMRIDTRRLSRTVQRSVYSTREIRDTLQRLSLTGLPQPLEYSLRELAEKFPNEDHTGEHRADAVTVSDKRPEVDQHTASASDPITEMVERVYASAHESDEQGDLTRRLKLAIRDRVAVQVTAVAGSSQHVFTLLPVSLQGDRLRATDQQAGVERTLPVSAITSVIAA